MIKYFIEMIKIEKDKDLLKYNSYKINITAKYFVELKIESDYSDIYELFDFIKKEKIKKFFVLGSGANVIFKNNFYDGIIIKLKNNFTIWENENTVCAGAGLKWDNFLRILQEKSEKENRKNFYDIQALSLIPGTVGAAIFGNIGAFGTEVKKYIKGVEYFDIEKKEVIFIADYRKFEFSYRNSFFKKNKNKYIILSVTFDFSEKYSEEVNNFYKDDEYFSLEHFAKKHNLGKIKKSEIRENIIKIRKNIYPDIEKFPNVGSTFKNAEVSQKEFEKIFKKYPEIPNWKLENGKIKIPTAYVFDKILNLNGKTFGKIKIHPTRPLFFMNIGGANGEDFFNLCNEIKEKVFEKMGIKINEEVVYVE